MTIDSTPGADDFTRIHGIGSAIQQALHEAGIVTYAQLASLSDKEIAGHLSAMTAMTAERIAQQEWVAQARELALAGGAPAASAAETTNNGQHYATFTVELLLESNKEVRRTRIAYVQDGIQESWAGWEGERLLHFITSKADVKGTAEPDTAATAEPIAAEPEPPLTSAEAAAAPAPTGPAPETPQLRRLAVVPTGSLEPRSVIQERHRYDIKVDLDLGELAESAEGAVEYALIVYAKPLGGGRRQTVGKAHGTADPRAPLTVTVPGEALAGGAYRLEVELALSSPSARVRDVIALLPGKLLQVY